MSRKFPHVKQHDSMDCGAACLSMVSRFYGRKYRLEELREMTYLDRQGVSLKGISEAAENIGFHTLAVKTSYQRLHEEMPLPCIAHWRQNHFVVVYEAGPNHVWVGDPKDGVYKFNRTEFLDGWASDVTDGEQTGVLLLMETTPEFYQMTGEKVDKGGFGFLFHYVLRFKSLLFQLALGLLLGSLLQLIFPFLTQALVDVGIGRRETPFIYIILAAQLMLFAGRLSLDIFRGWIMIHIGTRVNISLVSDFLIKLMKLPARFFDTKLTGDLLQRIADNYRIEQFLTSSTLITAFSMINFLIFGIILFFYSKLIFLVFLISALLYVTWVSVFLKKRRALDYKRFDQMSKNQSSLIQLINGMQEIKVHNAEKYKRWQWERIQSQLFKVNLSSLTLDQWQRGGASFINEFKNILITFIAAKAVIDNEMTLGMMLAVQYIIGQLNAPLEQLFTLIQQAQDAKISLERLNEIHLRENEEKEESLNVLPDDGSLYVDKVSFRYGGPHSPLVINNITLRIPEGKTTAIVGTSGSGKTTLLKLLLNFYSPTGGEIRVGGVNLNSIQHRIWREQCGVVMQEGFIFSDTIARNIAFGEEQVDKKKLLRAVKIANIQGFIDQLPLGYNTMIGEDGIGLSQGQKQRILIARAVYKNPKYVFFDEATNALDAFNEMVIMENLEEFLQYKTVVVVAHRLSTVRSADNIIVMEKGEIIESGTHEELTRTRGAYFHLVKNQLELGA
jgi:ATP-binding cassette subfamily B protein